MTINFLTQLFLLLHQADSFLAQEEADNNAGAQEQAEITKRKNEERRQREEDKMNEMLAQQKLGIRVTP